MTMKSTPLFVALLMLTACGGSSDSEPTPAPQSDSVVADGSNTPGQTLDDPITASDTESANPDPAEPVQPEPEPIDTQAPVQEPVQEPEPQVQEPVQQPEPESETPVQQPVQEPVQETETPVQEPAPEPVQEPVPEPVQEPEAPVQQPVQEPEEEAPAPVTTDPEQMEPEPVTPPQAIIQDTDNVGGCSVPAAGSTIVSKTNPVIPNDNPFFYPIMGPHCVTPPSQFDGPGLSYGDFLLSNNAWNGQQSSWDWQQCISITEAADGSILPSWSYDWGNEDDLQPGLFEWEVKSFPEIIYGYKSNRQISAPCESTGLPATISTLPDISIGYSYRAPLTDNRIGDRGDEANNPPMVTGGDRNIAIESFFHTSCDIQRGSSSNQELELMVWLEKGNERLPSGQPPVAQYTSSTGLTYDVYTKSNNYVAYVAQNTVRSDTLNYSEFIDNAITNASSYGIKTLQDDWCMANIIFGSEIWWGEGSVNLDFYQITSQY